MGRMNNSDKKENADQILSYLDQHGVVDKDASSVLKKRKKITISRKHPRAILDLHGMKSDEAARKIRSELTRCSERGIKELLIIHGKGYHSAPQEGPVLKNLVRDMLERELGSMIRDFRTALPKDGGEGATLVYLR
jgi:DNA-nicking Smr family endonuclease